MKKYKNFDCVEFQRTVRLKHYEEAKGDFDLMLKLQDERLKTDSLWLWLINRKMETKVTEALG